MSLVVGGSRDGENRPGYPFEQRLLVLFQRDRWGESVLTRFETYRRDHPGGEWRFLHEGPKTPADGPWNFEGAVLADDADDADEVYPEEWARVSHDGD